MGQRGHEVTCYNRRGCDNGGLCEYRGVKLKTVFAVDKKGLSAMTASVFASIRVALGNYDVIHFHAEGSCAMLWLPHLFRKKCIVTIHGLDWDREKWKSGLGSKYIKFGEKIAARYADEIIVLSESAQNYFKKTYGRETHFIPNGVSRPKARVGDLIKKRFDLEKDSYILFLGRIVPEKGLRYLIDAYKGLNTEKKLVIAGDASDTDEFLQELTSMAEEDSRIIFTGFVTGQLREELYSNAYVYVLPSDLEGMPLSLLEAMSYGNCCVVSDIAECTEVVENKAVIFRKSDTQDLMKKLQVLCDDKNIVQEYKERAACFICDKYNWDSVVDETLGVY